MRQGYEEFNRKRCILPSLSLSPLALNEAR
jgi:hypothetical protein